MQRDAPGPVEREAFSRRRGELLDCLRAAGEEAIRPHIASVFASLRHASEDARDRAALQRIFAADLADVPLFAIDAACRDFRQGRTGDGHWVPTQAEIRRRAEEYAAGWRDEVADLRQVLDAKVIENRKWVSPEEHERIKAGLQGLAAEIVASNSIGRVSRSKPLSKVTPSEAKANLDRLAAEYPARPVAFGPALRRVLELPDLP